MTVDLRALEPHVYLSGETRSDVVSLGRFEESTRGSWFLWGLVALDAPRPEALIRRAIEERGGEAVTRLRITTERTFLDATATFLTLGLYSQRTMRLEGTVVGSAAGEPRR